MTTLLAATLSCGSGVLLAQQQNPAPGTSTQGQDVPHQQPGTDSPDMGKQRTPTPKTNPGHTSPSDVPHQQPGTDSPDMGKQRVPTPGTSSGKSKTTRKKNKSTASQTTTS